MAQAGSFGQECASIEDRLLYAVGRVLIVISDITPNVKNIRLGVGR
jgi:hypothetical protein